MSVIIPPKVKEVISHLQAAGYAAYVVGGCVRDSLLGVEPKDWDVCTDASPQEIKAALSCFTLLDIGIKHGTISVINQGELIEVTAFRVESEYKDHRHPDFVSFSKDIKEDLSRRDFTINAMAYSDDEGLIDLFGGEDDLKNKIIRCVGNPDERFAEDGLRIMRALRFSSVLGFEVEEATSKSISKNAHILPKISAERFTTELLKLICGRDFARVLRTYYSVLGVIIPELVPMVGFAQRNPYHIYDVFEHTLKAMELVEPQPTLRLTMLLHDIGKPRCFSLDSKGIGHFYGHAKLGSGMAKEILSRLRLDNATINRVATLIYYHYSSLSPDPKSIKRLANKIGIEDLRLLFKVRAADDNAKCNKAKGYFVDTRALEYALDNILKTEQCFSLKQLALKGTDLLAMGFAPDENMGKALNKLLEDVIEGKCKNTYESLSQQVLRYSEYKTL